MRLTNALLGIIPMLHTLFETSAFTNIHRTRRVLQSQRRNLRPGTLVKAFNNFPQVKNECIGWVSTVQKKRNAFPTCASTKSHLEIPRRYSNSPGASKLYAATLDVDSNADTDNSNVEGFFEGELVSFVSAGDGIGMAAVKVKDDILNSDSSSAGDSSNESSTNMFGGNPDVGKSDAAKKNGLGQGDDLSGRTILFHTASKEQKTGIIVAQRHPVAFVLCNFDQLDQNSTSISILQSKTNINVSPDLVGKVIDAFGNDLLQSQTVKKESSISKAIFSPIPKVDEISLINEPLLTGITTIDVLTPIGKGQNMLLIGNDSQHQRDIIIDTLTKQVKEGTKCVYACTSSDNETRSDVLNRLKESELSDKVVTVCTRDNLDPTSLPTAAAEAVVVASSACSIAETFAKEYGEDTLVIVDVLDYHKDLWDATTRSLVDLYGADSVVQGDISGSASSEMRGFYSGLVQRSAKFNKKMGNGTLTLIMICSIPTDDNDIDDENMEFKLEDFDLSSQKIKERIEKLVQAKIPLTAATLRKIQIPIPIATEISNEYRLSLQHIDDLISMSDGQIWLVDRAEESTNLILDVQRSITRIGIGADTKSRADAPALQALTGGIRFELAQSLDTIENKESERSQADVKFITKRDAWLLAMHQDPGKVRTLSEECVVLLAAKTGKLDDLVKSGSNIEGREKIEKMLKHVWEYATEEMQTIDHTLDFASEDSIQKLEKAITDFFL